jgi:protein TonB
MTPLPMQSNGLAPARVVGAGTADDDRLRVLDLGRHATFGIWAAALVSMLFHGAALARAWLFDPELVVWSGDVHRVLAQHFAETVDIEAAKVETPDEPPPVQDEQEKDIEPPKPDLPAPPKEENPYADVPPPSAPPQAAQAGAILAAPDDVVDFTGDGFVTGTAAKYAGGTTQAGGTSEKPVYDPAGRATGVPGGTGSGTAPPAPTKDLSRPPALAGSSDWRCPWPPEADAEQIDEAHATIRVVVGPDGRAQSATIVDDPFGHGFGREARGCALRESYSPALDRDGKPTSGVKTFRVRFER